MFVRQKIRQGIFVNDRQFKLCHPVKCLHTVSTHRKLFLSFHNRFSLLLIHYVATFLKCPKQKLVHERMSYSQIEND